MNLQSFFTKAKDLLDEASSKDTTKMTQKWRISFQIFVIFR